MAKETKEKGKMQEQEVLEEALIRILSTDIPGDMSVYAGLTRIKGVSWTLSNAVCFTLGLDKNKKVSLLSPGEIENLNSFLRNPKVPTWIFNRRRDRESGEDKHLLTNELDMSKEWDVRRMKKMRSYKGWRHALGQPVRGQRTKSHFRKESSVGVRKGKEKGEAKAAEGLAKKK